MENYQKLRNVSYVLNIFVYNQFHLIYFCLYSFWVQTPKRHKCTIRVMKSMPFTKETLFVIPFVDTNAKEDINKVMV